MWGESRLPVGSYPTKLGANPRPLIGCYWARWDRHVAVLPLTNRRLALEVDILDGMALGLD